MSNIQEAVKKYEATVAQAKADLVSAIQGELEQETTVETAPTKTKPAANHPWKAKKVGKARKAYGRGTVTSVVGTPPTAADAIVSILKDAGQALSVTDLEKRTGNHKATIYNALTNLVQSKKVDRVAAGQYKAA